MSNIPFEGNPILLEPTIDVLKQVCELHVRTRKALIRSGCDYLGELIANTDHNFRVIRGCGDITISEIKAALEELNLSFSETEFTCLEHKLVKEAYDETGDIVKIVAERKEKPALLRRIFKIPENAPAAEIHAKTEIDPIDISSVTSHFQIQIHPTDATGQLLLKILFNKQGELEKTLQQAMETHVRSTLTKEGLKPHDLNPNGAMGG